MSRGKAAAAAIGSAIPPRTDMHLVMQRLPTGEPNRVVVRSAPFGEPNPVDFGALVIFSMLSRHTLLKKRVSNADETPETISGLQWERGAFRNTRMNYDVWTEALSWLLDGNAFRLFISMMSSERFPTSNQERLEQLAIPLRRVESRVCISSHLFAQNYQRRFEIACLLDATLNADQVAVERLFKGKDEIAIKAMFSTSGTVKAMFSTSGTAVIAHLGIERTGTPLQMALYSHDEAMFKLLADQMDPGQVQRQCKVIFDRYEVADYNGLFIKLEADANGLCGELKTVFSQASATDITNALNRVPGTTSALQDVLNRFNINLDRYVRTNPVHNPYVLQRLFEIYDQLPYDWNTERLISQQAIGLAQKLSSTQWLQHFAQGIYSLDKSLDKEWNAETPRREFSCRDSIPALDIRSSSVLSRLGVDSCIDIFGRAGAGDAQGRARRRCVWGGCCGSGECFVLTGRSLSKLLSSKNSKLGNLCSQRFATSEQERLEQLAIRLRRAESRVCIPSHLFAQNYQKRLEITCFLDATFNADLATVKALLENSWDPATLLSISGEVLIDGYPDITRRGTALQLALRSGDTEMVDLMACYLPPSEFIRQFESVFGTDFAAFERKQEEDAVKLFKGLEYAFKRASATEISNALNHVPGTTSVLHTALAAFKSALEKYILENPNHNDFILAKAYEIYEENYRFWIVDQKCLFSQQIIGLVQASTKKTSSFRLQDYAQGIYYRGEKNEAPARSYNLRRTSVDIRTVVDLGSSSCINILARGTVERGRWAMSLSLERLPAEKLCEQKQQAFRNYAACASAVARPV